MKAIIIAAGLGSRLGELTQDKPKCLLAVNGKTILARQIESLSQNGMTEIILIKGYRSEALADLPYPSYLNNDFKNNNILGSLMYAEAEMDAAFIASYSDILYTPGVVSSLLSSQADISLVIDVDWQKNYIGRTAHPTSEAEKVVFDDDFSVVDIGKSLQSGHKASGEFIGLFMCSQKGAQIFRDAFLDAKKQFEGQPFFNAPCFEKAYITDMILYLLSQKYVVKAVPIRGGWMEIDTVQDLEKARECGAWQ